MPKTPTAHQRTKIEAIYHRQAERKYRDALDKLTALLHHQTCSKKMNHHLRRLQTVIAELKKNRGEDISELTKALTQTLLLLVGDLKPEQYEETAKTMQGGASQGMRAIGSIMLAIAVTALSVGLAGFVTPIAMATSATLLLTSSVCFFSSRAQGLSAAMSAVATDKAQEHLSPLSSM